ncbi:hypothetical protein SK128_009503 [Halocaridina rubra]|uniref:Uncharacterized protein n=1 Tax=Halocaridina rubra TaxID=373956 RepID=A0AAN8X2H7_HALRR
MAQYKHPQQLNFVDPNWDRFITKYETFRLFTELNSKPGEFQVTSLKYCMGTESEEVMKMFTLSTEETKDYKTVTEKLKESIRDQFVAGILNEDLVEKIELLYYSKDGVLTLDDNVEYAWMYNDIHEGRKQEKEQSKSSAEVKFLK